MKNKPRLPNNLKPTILAFYESKIEENIELADAILDEYSINDRFIGQLALLLDQIPFSTRHFQYTLYWNAKKIDENCRSYDKSKTSIKYINR